jgi:RNA polymerase sigma-70 factor (ECF subfamily)
LTDAGASARGCTGSSSTVRIDWARARALRAEVGDGPLAAVAEEDLPADSFSPPVVAALSELSPDHRAVIVLRHLLEYTPGEIAELLEVPRGTVNSRLRRRLDELADRLEREGR